MSPDKDIPVQKKKKTPLSASLQPVSTTFENRFSLMQLTGFIKQHKDDLEESKIHETDTEDLKSITEVKKNEEQDNMYFKGLMARLFFTAQINKNGWLGENASAIPVSDFDRINGGNDILVGIKDPKTNKSTYFTMDVTYLGDPQKGKNIDGIKNKIKQGKLESLKYFVSPEDGKTPVENVEIPKVVVGFDDNNLTTVVGYWLMEQKNPKMTETLQQSPFQIVLLEEIIKQTEAYIRFAKAKSKFKEDKDRIISEYEDLLSVINNIEEEKLIGNGYGSAEEYFEKMGKKMASYESIHAIDVDKICNALVRYFSDAKFIGGRYTTD